MASASVQKLLLSLGQPSRALCGLAVVEVQLGLCSFGFFTFPVVLRGLLNSCKTPFCFTNSATS